VVNSLSEQDVLLTLRCFPLCVCASSFCISAYIISLVPPKFFTLAEANRTLPLVKRIVADLVSLHPQWRDLVSKYEVAAAGARPDWGESTEQLALRGRIEEIARHINDYLEELGQIGCVFKGFDQGLVDFYGKLDGRDIFWCWKQGEDRIEHWHELETGYAGRQPIPEVVNSQ
jgi:hypothetical protein